MSDKNTPGTFRESFKGYNKDDVNAYIQMMFHQFEERERNIQRKMNQTASDPTPYQEIIQGLQNEVSSRDSVIIQKDAEIAALQARITEMTENSARYERMSAQVGDIMLRARSDADHLLEEAQASAANVVAEAQAEAEGILNCARTESETVRAQANTYSDTIRGEALKQADTIISYASDRMKHLYHEVTEGYAKVLDTLRHQTEHFAEKLAEYRESFPNEVEDAREIAKESVRQMALGLEQQT